MANWLNNRQLKRISPFGLILLLLLCCTQARAQYLYNKVYSFGGSQTAIYSIAPIGHSGAFVAFVGNVDSLSGRQSVKMIRSHADGRVAAQYNIVHPQHPDTSVQFYQFNEACKIHDNLYALVTVRTVKGRQWGSTLFLLDSNGNILQKSEILEPIPMAKDTFSNLNSLRYDGQGHLLLAGQNGSALVTDPDNYILLLKYDTSLNLLWRKMIHPKSDVLDMVINGELVVEPDRYLLFGGASHNTSPWMSEYYREQSLMIATDTAGDLLWYYGSPVKGLYECEPTIRSGLPTADGGYLYLSSGDVYNFYPGSGGWIYPMGKDKLIKLDAARHKVWEKPMQKFNIGFGSVNYRMLALEDSSIVMAHSYSTDSLPGGIYVDVFLFSRFRADGSLMYQRKLSAPRDAGDTSRTHSSWGTFDMVRRPDKGFLLGGAYYNGTGGSATYNHQKAWVIRLDSNGFLAAGDTGSVTVGIRSPEQASTPLFQVYPNPNEGSFVLARSEAIAADKAVKVKVYDILGRVLLTQSLNFINGKVNLQLPQAFPGQYILYIDDGNAENTRIRFTVK